ncbi:hypothetical protein OROMI_018357 [Orobanche minor]
MNQYVTAHSWNILVKWCFLQSSNSWAGRYILVASQIGALLLSLADIY